MTVSPRIKLRNEKSKRLAALRKEFEDLFWTTNRPGNIDYLCELVFQVQELRLLLEKLLKRTQN